MVFKDFCIAVLYFLAEGQAGGSYKGHILLLSTI